MNNLEIERKFLVDIDKIPYDLNTMEKKEIELFGDFAPQKALWNTYNIERRCV